MGFFRAEKSYTTSTTTTTTTTERIDVNTDVPELEPKLGLFARLFGGGKDRTGHLQFNDETEQSPGLYHNSGHNWHDPK
jgi:hypothetical protein